MITNAAKVTDAEFWLITALGELDGVETTDENNCLKAAVGAIHKAIAATKEPREPVQPLIEGYKEWAAENYPMAAGWNSGTEILLRQAWMAAVLAERERILARAKSRYDHEVKGAAHHAGSWHAAFEHHMTRQAAMADMLDAIRKS